MPRKITVEVDEYWPVYECTNHTKHVPDCAVEISDYNWDRLKRAEREYKWAQRFLKDCLEVQQLKWSYQHEGETPGT